MMTLIRICGQRWHAVERDLISLGYHKNDIGTKLTVWELNSIVDASPPGSAVYHAETRAGSMTPEAQLLANLGEQHPRHARPSVDSAPVNPKSNTFDSIPVTQGNSYMGITLKAMPADELKSTMKRMRDEYASKSDRVVLDKYSEFKQRGAR